MLREKKKSRFFVLCSFKKLYEGCFFLKGHRTKNPIFFSWISVGYNKGWGFPGGSDSKESTCNLGDLGSVPGLARSHGGGHNNSLQYSCLENPHGQRSLVG